VVIARIHLEDVAISSIQPGEQKQSIAHLDITEPFQHGRIENERGER
jgi:hypothetical protein